MIYKCLPLHLTAQHVATKKGKKGLKPNVACVGWASHVKHKRKDALVVTKEDARPYLTYDVHKL